MDKAMCYNTLYELAHLAFVEDPLKSVLLLSTLTKEKAEVWRCFGIFQIWVEILLPPVSG